MLFRSDAHSDHSDSESGASPQHQSHHLTIDASTTASEADMTIKPESTQTVTPANVQRANGQPSITDIVANLKLPEIEGESSDLTRLQWDDDQLEDLGRLGEGAGGSVNRVRDRKTGKVIAKKVRLVLFQARRLWERQADGALLFLAVHSTTVNPASATHPRTSVHLDMCAREYYGLLWRISHPSKIKEWAGAMSSHGILRGYVLLASLPS